MRPRSAPVNISILLLLAGLSFVLLLNYNHFYSSTWFVIGVIATILQLVGLNMILKESTLLFTNYFRFISLCFAVYIVGALFKIMHWYGSDQLLLFSIAGVGIIYFFRTINKKPKYLLDVIKCVWVMMECVSSLATILHQPNADILSITSFTLFIILCGIFILYPQQRHVLPESFEEKPLDQVD